MSVLRQMYSWAIDESVLKRKDNPASRMQKNLPKQKRGETVLTLREARIVWQAAADCGDPFGTHAQLMLLDGCRLDEYLFQLLILPTQREASEAFDDAGFGFLGRGRFCSCYVRSVQR